MPMKIIVAAFLGAAAALLNPPAQAQAWPSKPIRFVVPFAPGGANDLLGRAAAEGAAKALGQPVIIDNKPGAGGGIGSTFVARSASDGYTFLISAAGVISNPMIKKNNPYRDAELVPVAMIGLAPSVIVVAANSKFNTLREFVEASKSGTGFHFATAGTGSTPHFVAEMLNTGYGAKLSAVPYKSGSESSTAVAGGQIEATSEASIVALPYIQAGGKLKALASTWTRRIGALADLPTTGEQGFPEVQIAHWAGVHAPAGVPDEILDKMAAAIDAAMKSPATVEKFKKLGIEPIGGSRAQFVDFVNKERLRLGTIVKVSTMQED